MLILRDISAIATITNPAIRQLVALRFQQLNSPDALDTEAVEFVVVQSGDEVSDIEQAAGVPILTSLFDGLPYTHVDYVHPFEFIERHSHENTIIFELLVITADSGAGTTLFVPDEEGVEANLLSMLREFATPSVSSS